MSGGTDHLLDTLMNMPDDMMIATFALVLQALETCATPIFCFLLVEGAVHTSDFTKYLVRILALAVITEIPYNFAYSATLFDLSSRNPVFGLVLSLDMIYLYKRYSVKSVGNILIKLLVTVAAFIWANMLGIVDGACCVLIVAVLWAFRNKPVYRNIMGCTATIVCTLFSMYYLAAPMSFMIVHFYNGDGNRTMDYLAYPVILTVIGIAAWILF